MGRRKSKRTKSRAGRRKRGRGGTREWVGGVVQAPVWVDERDPYRPRLILWLELPDQYIVSTAFVERQPGRGAFGDSLLVAMESPEVGPRRRPARVRVADEALAAEVHRVAPDLKVAVMPTPELEDISKKMFDIIARENGGPGDVSYFGNGMIPVPRVDRLFEVAEELFDVAPWELASDMQLVRLDIPELGVEGAGVSIVGAMGQSLGFIIFPSDQGFEAFMRATRTQDLRSGSIDLGTPMLSLSFERLRDLPHAMQHEAAENGWPVAGPNAYPWVQRYDRRGAPQPVGETNVRVVTACAMALGDFILDHADVFESEPVMPVGETYFDPDELEVRITAPYSALRRAAPASGPRVPARRKVGRNEPCPCGSGNKYKRCCLSRDEGGRAAATPRQLFRDLDEYLLGQVLDHSNERGGSVWDDADGAFEDFAVARDLVPHWAAYHAPRGGKTRADRYREAKGSRLSADELAVLDAEQAAWLSVWEVQSVEPGRSLALRDLLTYEERTVIEASASQSLRAGAALLARVVDYGGSSFLCGMYMRSLPPLDAAEVVRRARGRLRRKRAVPIDRLRPDKFMRYLIKRWEEAVLERDVQRSPPSLLNTSGDPVLLTVDHFAVEVGAAGELADRLDAMPGVEAPDPDHLDQTWVFAEPGGAAGFESTIVGQATLDDNGLRVGTNSIARADELRTRIEQAAGPLIRHRAREHSDPLAWIDPDDGPAPRPPVSPSLAGVPLQLKAKVYASWPDESLAALGGRTPREAVRSRAGRDEVDLLLRHMEHLEAALPPGERFDFGAIRRELDLPR